MANQMVFKRYELKYLLDQRQKEEILRAMEPHMALDRYGRTTIRNVYFDTDSYRLIRRSIEKPAYKEKLRVRSYKEAGPGDPVFVELKKKYKSVVYKRRILLPRELAMDCLEGRTGFPDSQIGAEIAYFCAFYGTLHPVVFLSYEREAFYDREGSDFRVTFDENILYRNRELSLGAGIYGRPLLERGRTLMEVKTSGGIPLWMARALSEQQAYKTSFSKYGSAYQEMLQNTLRIKGGLFYA